MPTTTTDPLSPANRAAAIRKVARDAHVAVTAHGDGIVTAEARFPAGDRTAYLIAEAACAEVLRLFRQTSAGSVWGTTSDSVGGMHGLTAGYCRLNKSGIERRLANQFLGADPNLTLTLYDALDRRDTSDRAAVLAVNARRLRDALAELTDDDGHDHLAHLGGQVIDAVADLADARAGRGGCAAELEADIASLTARIRVLLAVEA